MEPPSSQPGCVIVSAFPASGKTWLAAHCKLLNITGYKVLDLDPTLIPKVDGQRTSDFKECYLAMVKESIAPDTIILLSTHEEIRSALVEEGLEYSLVYPQDDLKQEWIDRLHSRQSPDSLISIVRRSWSSMLDECGNQGGCARFVLKEGQYLSDIIDDIVDNSGAGRNES